MKICNSCGKKNSDEAKYCLSCGCKFETDVTENHKQSENGSTVVSAASVAQEKRHFAFTSGNGKIFDFQNPIALILYALAIVTFIIYFFVGLINGIYRYDCYEFNDYYMNYDFTDTVYTWLKGFIVGTSFMIVGKIINVLQKILNNEE